MLVGPSGASRAGLSQGEPWGHRAMGMQSHRQVGHKAPETWHGGAEAHRGWAPPTQSPGVQLRRRPCPFWWPAEWFAQGQDWKVFHRGGSQCLGK